MLCALAGRHPSPHAVQGHGEGQALCALVLQEGAGLQQVRDPQVSRCSSGRQRWRLRAWEGGEARAGPGAAGGNLLFQD